MRVLPNSRSCSQLTAGLKTHPQVMDPLRSRCLCVRVPGPSNAHIQEQLSLVARKEGFTLPTAVSSRVALASHRNLRRALLMLEVAYVQSGGQLADDTKVLPPDWELYIMVSQYHCCILHPTSLHHHTTYCQLCPFLPGAVPCVLPLPRF